MPNSVHSPFEIETDRLAGWIWECEVEHHAVHNQSHGPWATRKVLPCPSPLHGKESPITRNKWNNTQIKTHQSRDTSERVRRTVTVLFGLCIITGHKNQSKEMLDVNCTCGTFHHFNSIVTNRDCFGAAPLNVSWSTYKYNPDSLLFALICLGFRCNTNATSSTDDFEL